MIDKIFIDSNVWCYLFIKDEYEKYKIAEKFILEKIDSSLFVISYQVVNEVTNNAPQVNARVPAHQAKRSPPPPAGRLGVIGENGIQKQI